MARWLPFLALLAGCAMKGSSIPDSPTPLAMADYTVLGSTNGEDCGAYVFGLNFSALFGGKNRSVDIYNADVTSIALPTGAAAVPESGRATYHALEKMPEATYLLQPRYLVKATGILLGPIVLFGERCATVEARGVQIGDGPTEAQDDWWEYGD